MKLVHPGATSPSASAMGRGNRKTDSGPEVAIRSALHRRGFRFRKNHLIPLPDRRGIRPDVVFTKARVAVFVDGCFWHSCPIHGTMPKSNPEYWKPKLARNVERDAQDTQALTNAGWTVVRVWEHTEPEVAAEKILKRLIEQNTSRERTYGGIGSTNQAS